MAKGQKRSNREVKKPKKNAGAKPSAGASNMFAQPPRNGSNPSSRKP